jgi:UDP-glucuronate 4-epimerase
VDQPLVEGWQVTVVDSFDPFYAPEIKRQNVGLPMEDSSFGLVEVDLTDRTEAWISTG